MQINSDLLKKLDLSFLKSKDVVGVDIGSSSVKLASLKGLAGKYAVAKCASAPLPGSLSTDTSPMDKKDDYVQALKSLVKEQGLSGKKAAASVSGNSVIVRYVKFPKLTPEELKKSIQFEAEPYIPFDIRDVNISFHIIGDVVDEGQKKMQTVLVAAKKELVQFKIDLLREAGLKPAIIDVDSFALENAYGVNKSAGVSETVLIVNIGSSVTNIAIVENGISRVVRDVFVSGNAITKILQKNLQSSVEEAEDIKKRFGILATTEDKDKALSEDNREAIQVSNIITPVLKDISSEIQRSLDFYLSQSSDKTINRVLLCGGSSKLNNIDKYFANETKLPVEIFNPFLNIKSAGNISASEAPEYAIAVGLAVRKTGDSL